MAHHRKRHAEAYVSRALGWSPAVGILGMRQTGKTTLLRSLGVGYSSFDDPDVALRFAREGRSLLAKGPFPLGLDEVQKYPPLFDLLKSVIDERKSFGRFLLTGSIRFSSRKGIRESLTGRIGLIDLFPLTLSESFSNPPHRWLSELRRLRRDKWIEVLGRRAWAKESQIENYLECGGLPGICFRRDAAVRNGLFDNHLDTLLGRDIQLIRELRLDLPSLREFFRLLCVNQGLPTNLSALAKSVGTTSPTAKKVLEGMEALFLVRPHGRTHFIEDVGLAHFGREGGTAPERFLVLSFVFHEIRAQLGYFEKHNARFEWHETRGGVDVPFVVRFRDKGPDIAITVDAGEHVSEKSLKSLAWFKKGSERSVIAVGIHRGKDAYFASNGTLAVPLSWVP